MVNKIGVYDYDSLVRLINRTFKMLWPEYRGSHDPQNQIQYLEATVTQLRLELRRLQFVEQELRELKYVKSKES